VCRKGLSIKDSAVREGRLSSVDILRKEGLQMRTSALFDAKKSGFFEIYGVSAWTRGG